MSASDAASKRQAEEDEEDDDSSDDDGVGLRRQVLAVDGEPDYSSGPPMDGFEYLRRVAYEAKQTPNIMRAKNLEADALASPLNTKHEAAFRDEEEELAAPSWARADREWAQRTIGEFSDLRVQISRMLAIPELVKTTSGVYPSNRDKRSWESLSADVSEPPLGAILALDAVTCAHLLRHVSKKIHQSDFSAVSQDRIIQLLRWFHALSARVDQPLDADTTAALRSAMKGIARARLLTKSKSDVLIPHLNLAMSIGGGYFKQWRDVYQ